MKTLTVKIEFILSSMSLEEKAPYIDRLKKYSSECGCSLGAKFLAVSLIMLFVYFIKFVSFNSVHFLREILYGLWFVFIASTIGKLAGIGIARLKLLKLYRSLVSKSHTKNIAYVNMHQVG